MPRTVQDIVDHGDELAKRFEDYEPRPGDERLPESFAALRRAVLERAKAEGGCRKPSPGRGETDTPGASSAH